MQVIHTPYAPPTAELALGCFVLIVANPSGLPVEIRLRHGGVDMDAAPFTRLVDVQGAGATYQPLPNGILPPDAIAVVSTFHASISGPVSNPTFEPDCPSDAFIESQPVSDATALIGKRARAIELLSNAPLLVASAQNYRVFALSGDGIGGVIAGAAQAA